MVFVLAKRVAVTQVLVVSAFGGRGRNVAVAALRENLRDAKEKVEILSDGDS